MGEGDGGGKKSAQLNVDKLGSTSRLLKCPRGTTLFSSSVAACTTRRAEGGKGATGPSRAEEG